MTTFKTEQGGGATALKWECAWYDPGAPVVWLEWSQRSEEADEATVVAGARP